MLWLTLLAKCFDKNFIEISYDNNVRHFQSLNRKTGIPFEKALFFDKEHSNVLSVGSLGIKCYHTPNNMMRDDWNKCLAVLGITN
jgi:hypothetical protein